MRRTEHAILLGVSILLLAGCGKVDSRVVTLYGGEQTFAALQSATTVEALRIDPKKYDEKLTDGEQGIAGYPITSEPVRLSAGQIKSLVAVLSNAGTYDFDIAKGCEFMPGVALRTTAGKHELVILLCYSCNEIAIYVDGRRVGGEDIDNARGPLVALAKQLFPSDSEIQSLK